MRDDVLKAARAVVAPPDGSSGPRRALTPTLLGTLLVLLAADAAHRAGWPAVSDWRWNAAPDASWLELFRGAQMLTAGALLLVVARRRRPAAVLVVWAAALAFLTVDDLAGVHESLGTVAARTFGLRAVHGIGGQDQGELVAWAVIAAGLGAAVLVAHRRSSHGARVASWLVAAGVAVQAVSAVGLDGLGAVLEERVSPSSAYLLALAEFSGESLGATAVLLAPVSLARRPGGLASEPAVPHRGLAHGPADAPVTVWRPEVTAASAAPSPASRPRQAPAIPPP